jgi:MYXO-CTERM domain-containing protein
VVSAPAFAAVDAGPPPPEDGGNVSGACQTTDDCAPPIPYCHPTLHTCVQCLADLNCFGVGYVCDQEKGVCSNCRTSADCYGGTPYCSTTLKSCVACLTDANCGSQGIKCLGGVCGACGDGICSDAERIATFPLCADCYTNCGKTDLRSKVGDKVASGKLSLADAYSTSCGPSTGMAGATFSWIAPSDGTYLFNGGGNVYLSVIQDDCGGAGLVCNGLSSSTYLTKGTKVVIVLTGLSTALDDYTLSISSITTMSCEAVFCPRGPNGEFACCVNDACGFSNGNGCVPATGVDPGSAMACVGAASTAQETVCMESTYCGCNACPKDRLTCSNTYGCGAIVACIDQTGCNGPDCYKPDLCGSVIDAHGGPSSFEFITATGVASCERNAGCALTCPGSSVPDASVGGSSGFGGFGGTSFGSGGAGSGGRGAVGASTGGKRSIADEDAGDSHGRAAASTSGGCGCRVSDEKTSPWSALAVLAGLGIAVRRRKATQSKRRPCP